MKTQFRGNVKVDKLRKQEKNDFKSRYKLKTTFLTLLLVGDQSKIVFFAW